MSTIVIKRLTYELKNDYLDFFDNRAFSDSNPNGNIYALASETCKAQAISNGWTWDNPNYINCMISEIQKYPAADEIQDKIMASLPSTELYRHNYASPVWAPTWSSAISPSRVCVIWKIPFRRTSVR